jgi:hypothetical protein
MVVVEGRWLVAGVVDHPSILVGVARGIKLTNSFWVKSSLECG